MRKTHVVAGLTALALVAGTVAAHAQSSSTTIQGRLYTDFSSKENKDDGTGTKSSDSGVGVDVKRFYFTVTHKIDDTWSAQFQSDIGDKGTKRYDVFVKKAYLQGKFSDAFTVRIGSADTPWIPFAEGMYGMRYVENTITDSLGFGDLGRLGNPPARQGAASSPTRSAPSTARATAIPTAPRAWTSRAGWPSTPVQGLTFAVGAYSGKLGKDTDASPAKHTAERTNALINWKNDRFGIGGEWFEAKNWKNVDTDTTDKADGYSIWAHFDPAQDLTVFAALRRRQAEQDPGARPQADLLQRRHPEEVQQGARRLARLQVRRRQGRRDRDEQRLGRLDGRRRQGQVQRGRRLVRLQLLILGLVGAAAVRPSPPRRSSLGSGGAPRLGASPALFPESRRAPVPESALSWNANMERHRDQELDKIRQTLLRMGGLVERMTSEAMQALVERDADRIEAVIRTDDEVDEPAEGDRRPVPRACSRTQQPTAVDLRFLVSTMKIATDLERMGDSAVNVAQAATVLNQEPPLKPYIDLPRLAEITQEHGARRASTASCAATPARAHRRLPARRRGRRSLQAALPRAADAT